MKTQKPTIWIISILNVSLLIILVYSQYWDSNIRDNEILNNRILMLEALIKQQKYLSTSQVYSDGIKLNSNIEMENLKGDKIQLAHAIINPKTLVMRFTQFNCNSCVDLILEAIMTNSSYNNSNALLLADYKNRPYINKRNNSKIPIYSIAKSTLWLDTLNMPYLFLIDQNAQVSNVYIPQEGDTTAIYQYLHFASKKIKGHLK